MSFYPRTTMTPGASRKRKDREATNLFSIKQSAPKPASAPMPPNQLLAGYMAYEFLTRGTLLGQKFDPARAEVVPLISSSSSSAETRRLKPKAEPSVKKVEDQSYAEVASILKTEGAHIPGIVNPSQLARWIKM